MAYTSKKRSTVDDPAMKLIDAAAYIGAMNNYINEQMSSEETNKIIDNV